MSEFPVSFVILTDGTVDHRIREMIDSIEIQNIPAYQILIVGGQGSKLTHLPNVTHLPFDETISPEPWITRKKNLAAPLVDYDVTVWMHDYHILDAGWYAAMVEFGLDWDIQMNQIKMINGHRMFDWVNIDYPGLPSHFAIPYDRTDIVHHQYISGGYWVSKRAVMNEEPLNEALKHHQAEDLEWSRRVLPKFRYVMNPNAIVRHNKVHRECDWVLRREEAHVGFTGWE